MRRKKSHLQWPEEHPFANTTTKCRRADILKQTGTNKVSLHHYRLWTYTLEHQKYIHCYCTTSNNTPCSFGRVLLFLCKKLVLSCCFRYSYRRCEHTLRRFCKVCSTRHTHRAEAEAEYCSPDCCCLQNLRFQGWKQVLLPSKKPKTKMCSMLLTLAYEAIFYYSADVTKLQTKRNCPF